jgi:2-keto-4-pentenoate hydratase/2-oxohepta-3-ene-1,7-dioic acid hydratase in catechol pathway
MRLITFGQGRVGATDGGAVWDLTARLGALSVKGLIERDLAAAARACTGPGDRRLDEVVLELPLPDPAKIVCVGVNYLDRNAEYRDGSGPPEKPSLFMRTPLSLSPHGAPIWRPRESEQLDYEGEIVLVIGKGGRRIPAEHAHAHIAGLTAMNEGCVRDWLRHGKFNVTQGKNFDRSGGLGPWIETDLAGIDLTDMTVETRVNGEVRQRDTTASMAFPFARIVEYVSAFATLLPGDLIATGTPTGAGARFDPPRWLVPGDVVEVEVEGVGTLRNTVEDEPGGPAPASRRPGGPIDGGGSRGGD